MSEARRIGQVGILHQAIMLEQHRAEVAAQLAIAKRYHAAAADLERPYSVEDRVWLTECARVCEDAANNREQILLKREKSTAEKVALMHTPAPPLEEDSEQTRQRKKDGQPPVVNGISALPNTGNETGEGARPGPAGELHMQLVLELQRAGVEALRVSARRYREHLENPHPDLSKEDCEWMREQSNALDISATKRTQALDGRAMNLRQEAVAS